MKEKNNENNSSQTTEVDFTRLLAQSTDYGYTMETKPYFSFFNFLVIFTFVFPFTLVAIAYSAIHKNTHIITHDCKLIERKYDYNHAVTIFDCGNNGILTSTDRDIFRRAKEYNKLKVKYVGDEYRILKLL